jgi:pilus assembly protein Flp/PilA
LHQVLEEFAMNSLICFLRDESGATSIEYAMIASGVAVAIVGAVNNLGSSGTIVGAGFKPAPSRSLHRYRDIWRAEIAEWRASLKPAPTATMAHNAAAGFF